MAEITKKTTKAVATKTAKRAAKRAAKPAAASAKPAAKKPQLAKKAAAPAAAKAALTKTAAAPAATAVKPVPSAPLAKPAMRVSDEQRYRMVAEAAYYRAESNQFKSDPVRDWIEAESDISILLSGGK